jgi:hypothetical protein
MTDKHGTTVTKDACIQASILDSFGILMNLIQGHILTFVDMKPHIE